MKLGKLTLEHLRKAGACLSQRIIFSRVFPNGFIPNQKNFEKALKASLNVSWAFNKIVKDYETSWAIRDKADNEYWKKREPYELYPSYQQLIAKYWWEAIEKELTS